jgi:hypothetical protein
MTISYQLYSSNEMAPNVLPNEHVASLSGESYKYASSKGGKKMTKKRTTKKRKSKKTRARKITPLK